MPKLGVNIDHVATIRQARKGREPDPVWAAVEAELGGADQITVHLREDRRHIQTRDVELLLKTVQVPVNLETAIGKEAIDAAIQFLPRNVCLVPERREEVTTEGGLDVRGNFDYVQEVVKRLIDAGITVSLFIDPHPAQIEYAANTGAQFIEMHTGSYASAVGEILIENRLIELRHGAENALSLGLRVNAGHGLNYLNVGPVAAIDGMEELNIGHAIVSRAVFTGLREAVREMKRLIS